MEILYDLVIFTTIIVVIAGVIGLVRPSSFKNILKSKAKRKHIALYSVGFFFVLAMVAGAIEPEHVKQARLEEERIAQIEKDKQDQELLQEAGQVNGEPDPEPESDPRYYWHKVVRVVDGDTIRALVDGKEVTIRVVGINAPESTNKAECFGKEATNKAKEFLEGKWIQLEEDKSQSDRDKYNRLLRYVWFDDGTDFGKRLIEEGFAHEATYGIPHMKQTEYKETQKYAETNSHGLWSPKTCDGKKQMPEPKPKAISTPAPQPRQQTAPQPSAPSSPSGVVKKSSTGICHAPGTTYYDRTKNYTSFNSLQACLDSGGRLPKR